MAIAKLRSVASRTIVGRQAWIPLLILILTGLYIIFGALIFQKIEGVGFEPGAINSTSLSSNSETQEWDFGSSVLFTFSIVTTIGYGNKFPVGVWGRLFFMLYALIGIPLGMLGIANIGRHFSTLLAYSWRHGSVHLGRLYRFIRKKSANRSGTDDLESTSNFNNNHSNSEAGGVAGGGGEDDGIFSHRDTPPFLVLILFLVWIVVGAIVIPWWETEMSWWDAFYFSFVSLTTIGFGDILPNNFGWFPCTYLYLICGLVITTMSIDVMANYLRKLHAVGAKLKNLGRTKLSFGDKDIITRDFMNNTFRQLPIEKRVVEHALLNIDDIVAKALAGTFDDLTFDKKPKEPPKVLKMSPFKVLNKLDDD